MATQQKCWAVVPAAGVGSRMGAAIPKQYLPLSGQPLLSYTLQALLNCEFITGLCLAVSPLDNNWQNLPQTQHAKFTQCLGGDNRAGSVLAGINALTQAGDDDWVMVHDAARPCIKPQQLGMLYDALCNTEHGGLWAIPVADTLKYVDEQHSQNTIDRSRIWRAQTPQMFKLGALREALSSALSHGAEITDEASAMERQGIKPKIIEGFSHNIKVTYTDDIALAEFYLATLHGDTQ